MNFPTQSEKIDILLPLLREARHNIKRIEKNEGGRFGYASFDYIIKMVEPVLHAHKLYMGFCPQPYSDNVILLVGSVWEDTGQFIRGYSWVYHPSLFEVENGRSSMQEYGSNMTYAKRYLIRDMLGLEIKDDDPDDKKTASAVKSPSNSNPATVSQLNTIAKNIANHPRASELINKYGDIKTLTRSQASQLISELFNNK